MKILQKLLLVQLAGALLLLGLAVGAAAGPDDETVTFAKAGCSLQLPRQWQASIQQGTLWNESLQITVKVTARDGLVGFDDEIHKIDDLRAQLARTVKESQFFTLLHSEPFVTGSNLTGVKAVYGYTAAAPAAISYYFINSNQDFVELRLEFRTWDSAGIWQETDETLLRGLHLN